MRSAHLLFLISTLALSGCADSHNRSDDAGPDADTCRGSSSMFCVTECGNDGGFAPLCTDGIWSCPPGTIDASTCPPTCIGGAPPGCVCEGTRWVCDDLRCPDGIDPWDPSDPASTCSVEGATCTGGSGDACGAGLFCNCEAGRWNCAVAEPDPVCWCGREPSEGDRCNEDGAFCGGCCPTVDGPDWPAMVCVDGYWTYAECPDVECPPVLAYCPTDTAAVVGTTCALDGQTCGNPCCDTAITCSAGLWERGPFAACACEPGFACGSGTCPSRQGCDVRCGPDDGLEHWCIGLPEGCGDCGCVPLEAWQTCEMIDGHPHVSDGGFCG